MVEQVVQIYYINYLISMETSYGTEKLRVK